MQLRLPSCHPPSSLSFVLRDLLSLNSPANCCSYCHDPPTWGSQDLISLQDISTHWIMGSPAGKACSAGLASNVTDSGWVVVGARDRVPLPGGRRSRWQVGPGTCRTTLTSLLCPKTDIIGVIPKGQWLLRCLLLGCHCPRILLHPAHFLGLANW